MKQSAKDRLLEEIASLRKEISMQESLLQTLERRAKKFTGDSELSELREQNILQTKEIIAKKKLELSELLKNKTIKPIIVKEFEEAGKTIAKWQKSKGREGLPYKEWEKKYGDRFTKV